ncbi:MAG: tRNA (adenosine(37)-N6)-threonylcarbamoyltransferase complex transferase subunit TsaD [Acidobacteria bacterium]|nr:tRNA (adenosine(37)-N6)-threonylcarbamoyltransferase complex transferase subunit TsaD [Acidobacteriota bacterium]MCI0717441.1 tRNA (adenosine(37)-N6)-threonylcarbamoyltransferase complex transferase subunit TsaD [Acidobacteriota bacterium]
MLILGIESSCDETAAAVLRDGRFILSNVIASQVAVHKKYGGVVPELASRHHLENIVPIVNAALQEAGLAQHALDGIAVTQGPGLVGSLLVGVNYAKALSFSLNKPLVAVNHLEGHIYSVPLELARSEIERGVPLTDWSELFPALCLIVSGGHTSLYWVQDLGHDETQAGRFELVGRTRDDAAGEAFDKVAKLLHLGYPGGPVIDRLSKKGDPHAIEFPVSKISDGKLDFSFSGIKTAVLRYVQTHLQKEVDQMSARRNEENFHDHLPQPVYDLIASFQKTAIEMLFDKTSKAAELRRPRSILVSGGVACNSLLRSRFHEGFKSKNSIPVYFPSPILSTDNAAMIAAAGYPRLKAGRYAGLSLNADVHLKLHE